jgi:HEAT repeat protein
MSTAVNAMPLKSRQFSIRSPALLWIGLATVVLIVALGNSGIDGAEIRRPGAAAKAALAALEVAVRNEDGEVLHKPMEQLERLEQDARAVPILLHGLDSSNDKFRKRVVAALGRICPANAEVIEALVQLLPDPDDSVRGSAIVALAEMGAPAFRPLRLALIDGDGRVRQGALSVLTTMAQNFHPNLDYQELAPLVAGALRDQDPSVRLSAALSLEAFGPSGKDGVPELIAAISDNDARVRSAAVSALGRIGPAANSAVPLLLLRLVDQNEPIIGAAESLGQIGAPAVGALANALSHADSDVRAAAAKALGRLGPAATPSVPQLAKRLMDEDRDVRVEAAVALWAITDKQDHVAPILAEAAKNDLRRVVEAVINIGPAAKDVVPALMRAMDENEGFLRSVTGTALGYVGADAAPAVPTLIKLRKVVAGSMNATTALGLIGRPAVPALREALRSPNADLRAGAAEALNQMGREARAAVPDLIAMINDDDKQVQEEVRGALRSIAFDEIARDSLSEILSAIERDSVVEAIFTAQLRADGADVSAGARRALVTVAEGQVPELVRRLADDDGQVRQRAAAQLRQIGRRARAAAPELRTLLEDEDIYVRLNAAAALWATGESDDRPRQILQTGLKHSRAWVRREAADLLGQLGPVAAPALSNLLDLLTDPSARVRVVAADALRQIDPDHPQLIPSLLDLLANDRESFFERMLAAEGLGKLRGRAKGTVPRLRHLQFLESNGMVLESIAKALQRIGAIAGDHEME